MTNWQMHPAGLYIPPTAIDGAYVAVKDGVRFSKFGRMSTGVGTTVDVDPTTGNVSVDVGLDSADGSVTILDNGDGTLDLSAAGGGGGGTIDGWEVPGYMSGSYYGNPWSNGSGTKAVVAGTLELAPFPVPAACTIDRLVAEVTGTGLGVVRLGIYSSTSSNLPGTLLIDAGTVNANAVGVRSVTLSQALSAGLYWLAALPDTAGGTWRTWGGIASQALGASSAGAINTRSFATGVTTGALPASAPALTFDSSTSIFRILARVA